MRLMRRESQQERAMRLGTSVLAVLSLLGASGPASGQQGANPASAERRFEEAVLVAESERNPEQAAALLYQLVQATDGSMSAELRTRAWLHIAMYEKRVGHDEAS